MAVAFVAAATAGNVSVTSVTPTFGSAPSENNLLVAAVSWRGDRTLTPPSGFAAVGTTITLGAGSAAFRQNTYYKVAGASEGTGYTWSLDTTGWIAVAMGEWSGLDTTTPLDQEASNSNAATGTSLATGTTGTTSQADELLVSSLCVDPGNNNICSEFTYTNGSTQRGCVNTGSSVQRHAVIAGRVVSATGTYSETFNWTTSGSSRIARIATFKAAAAGTTVTPAAVATIVTAPTPTVTAAATLTPTTVTSTTAAPTASLSAAATLTPAAASTVVALPTPTVTLPIIVTPGTVAAVATLPTATVTAGATVTPGTVATVTTLPTPTITAGATVTPAAATTATTLPTPTILAGATVTPVTVTAVGEPLSPSIDVAGNVEVFPAAIDLAAALPTATPTIPATLTPTVIDLAATTPASTVAAASIVTPTTLTLNVAVAAVVAISINPAAIELTVTIDIPNILKPAPPAWVYMESETAATIGGEHVRTGG